MATQTQYDNAMLRGPASVPVIGRLGGGTIATVGDNQPFRVTGGQSVVYQLRQATGKVLALRAWQADQIAPDVVERYRALSSSDLLKTARTLDHSPLVHAISWHSDAITIEADNPQAMSRPMVVLDWLMGPTVLAAVDRACRANDGTYLLALANAWQEAVLAAHHLGFIHGDLTADNAIVRPKEGIAFVDYDTAYWPDAPNVPVLDPAPAYRHPNGIAHEPERADDFAAFLIYVSLRLLSAWPELRVEHGQPATVKGAALVFQPRDLSSPDGSTLFGKSRVVSDPEVLGLVSVLREIALAPVTEVPPFAESLELAAHVARANPAGIIPRTDRKRKQPIIHDVAQSERTAAQQEQPAAPIDQDQAERHWPTHQRAWNPDALATLVHALETGDLALAEAAWSSVSEEPGATALLPALTVLRMDQAQVDVFDDETRAEQRQRERNEQVRRSLASALDRHDAEALADLALSGELDEVDDLTIASTRQVVAALAVRHLERAIESDDDILILDAFDESVMSSAGVLTEAQRNRVDLAFERREWLQEARSALRKKDRTRLDRLFAEMPGRADERLTARELIRIERLRAQDDAVRALEDAVARKSEHEMVVALNKVERLGAWLPETVVWADIASGVDRHTLVDAIHRAAHQSPRDYARLSRLLPQLKDSCGGSFPPATSDLDFEQLDREVHQITLIRRVREALDTNDDRQIVAAALPDIYGIIPMLERGEQARIERAVAAANRALRRSGQRTPMTFSSSATVDTT